MIWEIAGIVSVDPSQRTLRELVWMVDGQRREAWQHTSSLLATLANIHRDPKKKPRPFTASDFQPRAWQTSVRKQPQTNLRILKQVFVDRKS